MVSQQHLFVVEPHQRAGGVRFGMSRREVHGVLGPPDWCRDPAKDRFGLTRELFEAHCAFVDFDREGKCCGVETYPDAVVLLDDRDMMAMHYGELVAFLNEKGVLVVEALDGFRADAIGLSCHAPGLAAPDESGVPVESLLIYRRGYYDELHAALDQHRWRALRPKIPRTR